MTELKTLKDIEAPYGCYMKEQIRQEAIKWVKSFTIPLAFEEEVIMDWIKHFFNIIEEDLKCK